MLSSQIQLPSKQRPIWNLTKVLQKCMQRLTVNGMIILRTCYQIARKTTYFFDLTKLLVFARLCYLQTAVLAASLPPNWLKALHTMHLIVLPATHQDPGSSFKYVVFSIWVPMCVCVVCLCACVWHPPTPKHCWMSNVAAKKNRRRQRGVSFKFALLKYFYTAFPQYFGNVLHQEEMHMRCKRKMPSI